MPYPTGRVSRVRGSGFRCTLYRIGRLCCLDLTTPAGRAFAGFLAVSAEFERDVLRERLKAGITDTRKRGKAHGRPRAKANDAAQIRLLAQQEGM